jgi:hypothetical protein
MHAIPCVLFLMAFQEPTEAEVASVVDAYVQTDLGSPERTKIDAHLEKIRPARLTKPVLSVLSGKDAAKAGKALLLADAYRVPGLLDKAKKYFDGDHEAVALRVAMADPGGGPAVVDRWTKADPGSPSLAAAEAALSSRDILDLNTMSRLAAALNGDKGKSAASILAYQFNLQVRDPATISASWNGLKANFSRDSKVFAPQGTDLLLLGTMENARRIGANVKLLTGGKLVIPLPERVQSGNHSIRIHLLASGPKASADYQKLQGGRTAIWPVRLENNKWVVRTGDGQEFVADARPGEWTEVIFDVTDWSKAAAKGVQQNGRGLAITVDGKLLLKNGQHTGLLTDLIFTSEEGTLVVGSIDLTFPAKAR